MTSAPPRRALPAALAVCLALASPALAALPKVPDGFEARLVATVPAVHYPCQVATAPDGSLFVAEDPMDQVGPYESKHGRILRFRDDKDPETFADGFRAIQGMAWHDGSLYVSHMPFLTVLRDTDGDGKADRREDLFKDLGPTDNRGLNDHIVSGIQFGMDGWLYISVGDKGVPGATRPEDGQKVQLKGGGTLRCRPDGRELEVYSSGTRNHLEANLDAADNLFTYDNTDDGDGWWTRVTHHVFGGYYGYPYDYHGRPDRHLPRMAEYGGGSPCGATFYREDAWPEKYRGIGLWAEWGKGKVHAFRFAPDGSSFKVAEPIDFATDNGVPNFHPIDVAVSYDGKTLYIADWSMGGWGSKTEKVGRVFAVTRKDDVKTRPRGDDSDSVADQIKQLDHPSYNERMRAQSALIKKGHDALPAATTALADSKTAPLARRHLIWALDGLAGGSPEATMPLIETLKAPVPDLRAQAARALGERKVPIAVEPLVALLKDPEPNVRLQAVIALARIGDPNAVKPLLSLLADPDTFVAFSARQALRRINDWTSAATGLAFSDAKERKGLLAAMELVYETDAVRVLASFAKDGKHSPEERAKALFYLSQAHRKTKPWDGRWWGTRPTQGAPPAKEVEWDGTKIVLEAVRSGLSDPRVPVRKAAVAAVKETIDRDSLPTLRDRFRGETDVDLRREVASTLGALKDKDSLPLLLAALRDAKAPPPVRESALMAIDAIGGETATKELVDLLCGSDLDEENRARVIGTLGKAKAKPAVPELLKALGGASVPIRAAAAGALGKIGQADGVAVKVRPLIDDDEPEVAKAAVNALAALKDRDSIPALIQAAGRETVWYEASKALAAMPDVRALQVYLRGVTQPNPDLRRASSRALALIRDEAVPVLDKLAGRKELPPAAVPELVKVYAPVKPINRWRLLGPFPVDGGPKLDPSASIDFKASYPAKGDSLATWKMARPDDERGKVDLEKVYSSGDRQFAYGYAELRSDEEAKSQMVVGSDDGLTVWLNGKKVYDFTDERGYEPDQARFDVTLAKGTNRILVACTNQGGGWMFSVAATRPVDYAFLKAPAAGAFNPEEYRTFAMKESGDPKKGRALFADLKGLACIKCHSVGGQGGSVGPDLNGIGAKYAKFEIIDSVLYPSAKIFSGYEPVVVATSDGRVVTGILKGDAGDSIELQDADAQKVTIRKADIDERKASDVSLMPNGLAEGLSKGDFADLIAYLVSLKEKPAEPTKAAGGQ